MRYRWTCLHAAARNSRHLSQKHPSRRWIRVNWVDAITPLCVCVYVWLNGNPNKKTTVQFTVYTKRRTSKLDHEKADVWDKMRRQSENEKFPSTITKRGNRTFHGMERNSKSVESRSRWGDWCAYDVPERREQQRGRCPVQIDKSPSGFSSNAVLRKIRTPTFWLGGP